MYLYYADPSANRPDPLPPPAAGSYQCRVSAISPYGDCLPQTQPLCPRSSPSKKKTHVHTQRLSGRVGSAETFAILLLDVFLPGLLLLSRTFPRASLTEQSLVNTGPQTVVFISELAPQQPRLWQGPQGVCCGVN